MMEVEFNIEEFDEHTKAILRMAQELKNGRYTKQMLRNTGNKLQRRVVRFAKNLVVYDPKNYWVWRNKDGTTEVRKPTGNLFEGLKRGRVYFHRPTEAYAVRVYGGSPAYHTNLLNTGHKVILPDGSVKPPFKGTQFFDRAVKDYTPDFFDDVNKFVDKMLREHLA